MASRIWRYLPCDNLIKCHNGSVRYGHHVRGKPPGVAKSLEQKFQEMNAKDLTIHYRVDIGFAQPRAARSTELTHRLSHLRMQRKNLDIEKLARNKQLLVDLKDVRQEWLRTAGPFHIKRVADHFGIYEHLFGDAYFTPRTVLNVSYNIGESTMPVYYGNTVKPSEAQSQPDVTFESDPSALWTLILTNPDGHFTKPDGEYVHWFVGNIPGGDISKGETIIEYLQPFPPRGTGYQRMIFILYKQDGKLDYAALQKNGPCLELQQRTFSTLDFYRERQDNITPAGLAFFQSDWDSSLTDFFHNTLQMHEPSYEYDFPPPYIRPQEWFPLKKPFNLYMDKYRDPKKVSEEYLIKKLKRTHPFKGPEVPVPYPNAEPLDKSIPSWLKTEIRKERNRWGRINDV